METCSMTGAYFLRMAIKAREEARAGETPTPAVIEARDIDPACIRRASAAAIRRILSRVNPSPITARQPPVPN